MESQFLTGVSYFTQEGAAILGIVSAVTWGLYLGLKLLLKSICRDLTETALESVQKTVAKMQIDLAVLQVKVDTMWSGLMRRAEGAAVIRKMGTMNSPITFND